MKELPTGCADAFSAECFGKGMGGGVIEVGLAAGQKKPQM
jgi:hypothetical protein